MVSFMLRKDFSNGNLKERMEAEGLPQFMQVWGSGRKERLVYECSEELALTMLRDGGDLEFIEWTPNVLQYRKENLP